MAVLLPIWNEKPETARRVRKRIGAIVKWAAAPGHGLDNPASDALGAALRKTSVVKRHHRALPHTKVADAIATVQETRAHYATVAALEYLSRPSAFAFFLYSAARAAWSLSKPFTCPRVWSTRSRKLVTCLGKRSIRASALSCSRSHRADNHRDVSLKYPCTALPRGQSETRSSAAAAQGDCLKGVPSVRSKTNLSRGYASRTG